jgi:hypothetical protein
MGQLLSSRPISYSILFIGSGYVTPRVRHPIFPQPGRLFWLAVCQFVAQNGYVGICHMMSPDEGREQPWVSLPRLFRYRWGFFFIDPLDSFRVTSVTSEISCVSPGRCRMQEQSDDGADAAGDIWSIWQRRSIKQFKIPRNRLIDRRIWKCIRIDPCQLWNESVKPVNMGWRARLLKGFWNPRGSCASFFSQRLAGWRKRFMFDMTLSGVRGNPNQDRVSKYRYRCAQSL